MAVLLCHGHAVDLAIAFSPSLRAAFNQNMPLSRMDHSGFECSGIRSASGARSSTDGISAVDQPVIGGPTTSISRSLAAATIFGMSGVGAEAWPSTGVLVST